METGAPHPTRLGKIYVEPTNGCNLSCRTCVRNVWQEPMGMMPDAVFDRLISGLEDFRPPPTVFFGGFGEPLHHPRIVEMVRRAKRLGARVEMITNGTLLTADMSCRLLDAGLDMLWSSLDGTTPEGYADIRLGAELPRVVRNLAGFRDALAARASAGSTPDGGRGVQLGIEFVAMRRNINELPAALVLAHRLGAGHFIVTNLLPYTEELTGECLYSRGLRDVGYPQPALPRPAGDGPAGDALAAALRHLNVTVAGNNRQTPLEHCPFIRGESGAVRWDGGLSPCVPLLHSHTSFPAGRERFSRGWTIGSIADQSLAGLWHQPEHVAFRRRVLDFSFSPCVKCGGCYMAEKNEEDCLGNTFPTCGFCLWAEGAIRCP